MANPGRRHLDHVGHVGVVTGSVEDRVPSQPGGGRGGTRDRAKVMHDKYTVILY